MRLDSLPSALVGTIMTKLDIASICSLASTSSTFRSCSRQILSFLPTFHLLVRIISSSSFSLFLISHLGFDFHLLNFQDIAPSGDLLTPLLPPNPCLKTLKLDCARLDDSAIPLFIKPSLQDLCLHNCADFSGKLLSEIGIHCNDLRFASFPTSSSFRDSSHRITYH